MMPHLHNLLLICFFPLLRAQSFFGQNTFFNQSLSFNNNNFGPAGGVSNPENIQQDSFLRGRSFDRIDFKLIDRRAEEGWWHLYPFGEKYFDVDMGLKPWKNLQIDLEFYFPFCGFRFNYTFIYPEGFVAFDRPHNVQPPFTFPNPRWPLDPDPSFVAAFLMEQSFAHIGERRLSHVWYRVVSRPQFRFRMRELQKVGLGADGTFASRSEAISTEGRVEDEQLLDKITRDIQDGMVGTRGYLANYALIVTWERMGFGGQPKFLKIQDYERVKKWLNTYQMVITTDEIRSYVLFNYARINYTSSAPAGAIGGRGGRQSALVGFNAGNGTGFYELPYSSQGDSYKLVLNGATETQGRWLARVDELVKYGGCSNASSGKLKIDHGGVNMIGGMMFNVSGPCFRPNDYITMEVDEEIFDCGYVNMVKAQCVIPFNMVFKTGYVTIQITQDGRNYAWYKSIYMYPPALGTIGSTALVSKFDEINPWQHDWHRAEISNLSIIWSAANISSLSNSKIDINLWGYWEDALDRDLIKIGAIAKGISNTGKYWFNPNQLQKSWMLKDSWKKFWGGVVQVHVADHTVKDRGSRLFWSKPVPFGWYFRDVWRQAMGDDWALNLCIEWFEQDGRRYNFYRELETPLSCPCTLTQARADFGRFMPTPDCDMGGDASCYYTRGAQHCVVSVGSTIAGASQTCCYDFNGWLIFSQDYEYHPDYMKYGSAGTSHRAHPWGGYIFKKPPYVPSWSNFYNDLLPYDICCRWAGHCEFYYWRRSTSGCQDYKPPRLATGYGHGHFITFDNLKYTFNGRGHFVLTSFKTPSQNLNIQIRMEQPPRTVYNTDVQATVITGVAVQNNDSSLFQFFARKQHRRWRYALDVLVDGVNWYTDNVVKKQSHFVRATLFSPHLNRNQSDLTLLFPGGVGVRVLEMDGHVQVIVALPPEFNETAAVTDKNRLVTSPRDKCSGYYRTVGLLGTYNNDPNDDLMTPECNIVRISRTPQESEQKQLYFDFGLKWLADNKNFDILFNPAHQPIYFPNLFAGSNFVPNFDPWKDNANLLVESLAFSRDDEVHVVCQNVHSCMFDYLVSSRRHDGLNTLSAEKKFEGLKANGEIKTVSCGPLQKNDGVIKIPLGNNYLEGVTVTFACKIDYFLHGDQQRRCVNGTWTPGWWAWCRSRTFEKALKWLAGLTVSFFTLFALIGLFFYLNRKRLLKSRRFDNFLHKKRRLFDEKWNGNGKGDKNAGADAQGMKFDRNFLQWLRVRRRRKVSRNITDDNRGVVNVHFETDENGGKDERSPNNDEHYSSRKIVKISSAPTSPDAAVAAAKMSIRDFGRDRRLDDDVDERRSSSSPYRRRKLLSGGVISGAGSTGQLPSTADAATVNETTTATAGPTKMMKFYESAF